MNMNKYIASSHQQQSLSSTKTTTDPIASEPDFYLPDDCWEHVFTFLEGDFRSLSRVSKHFLSITIRLTLSIKISHPSPSLLSCLFHKFYNLNSLEIRFDSFDLDAGIALALRDRVTLKSLSIAWIDLNYVTSHNIDVTSQYVDSFVSLKGLNYLKFHCSKISDDLLYSIAREGLPLKSFVLEECIGYSYNAINCLLTKCHGIQHLGLQGDAFLNDDHVTRFSLLLPDLVSINLSSCSNLSESALFALIRNCHSLGEITMECIYNSAYNSDSLKDFHVNPRLKFLHLAYNSFITDETLILIASIFPNLEFLDLSFCHRFTEKGIMRVVEKCTQLKEFDLTYCDKLRGDDIISMVLSKLSLKKDKCTISFLF